MLDDSSFHEWSKGFDIKFSKEKGDLFSFQHKLLHHFQDMGMDTITYLKDPGDPTKMVNLLMDHIWFTQAYIKTAVKEQHKLYDPYDHSRMIIAPVTPCWTTLMYPSRSMSRIWSLMTSASLDAGHQGPAK